MAMEGLASAMKKKLRGGTPAGLVFEVEVVAGSASELQLPPGSRARFVLKRRNRLCVTEAVQADAAGTVEWNTRCTQTATLVKDGASWRPKQFIFKVQLVRDNPRLGQEGATTVAKAALDLSQFCMAEPFGPRQLVIPLQPAGVLSCCVRTQWLQHFDRAADSLTDLSYLSLGQSVATSAVGAPAASEGAVEQDLGGFDVGAAAAMAAAGVAGPGPTADGRIRAVYPSGAVDSSAAAGMQSAGGGLPADGSPSLKQRLASAALRLPRRGASVIEPAAEQRAFEFGGHVPGAEQASGLQRSLTAPALGGGRRPAGASQLQIPDADGARAAAAGAEAGTPTLFGRQGSRRQAVQQPAVAGLPPEQWSPVNLQEAVQQLYDSEEEATPRPTLLGTVKRYMLGRARTPAATPRQLHAAFGASTPQCTPSPVEAALIDRECSMSSLRRRCKALVAERDEARADGYTEAARAVEQSVEIDKLRREKDMLLQRLQTTEQQLLACFRDEASTDLIQARALAAARVEAAAREFQAMELQGQLRRKEEKLERMAAQLTRTEAKYRAQLHALSPGGAGAAQLSTSQRAVA